MSLDSLGYKESKTIQTRLGKRKGRGYGRGNLFAQITEKFKGPASGTT